MKIALGTVEISDADRAGIAHFYGLLGMADRDTCRRFIIDNGMGGIDDQMASVEASRDRREGVLSDDHPW